MKLHSIRLALAVLFIVLTNAAWSQTQNANTGKVIVVLNNKRGKVANYMYKDLSKGFRSLNYAAQISIASYKELNESLFKSHDVLILISERQKDNLDPAIRPFVKNNTSNKQLITVAFLPNGRSSLEELPDGIDAMTSASRERPAQKFVKEQLAPEVIKRINALRNKTTQNS